MIVQALAQYYQRLASQTTSAGLPKVPPFGYSQEKIGYVLVLSQDGEVIDVIPNLTADKKPKAKALAVPQYLEKRTSGIRPNFLWDKTAYTLGIEGNKDKKAAKETPWVTAYRETFEAFCDWHLELLEDSDDKGLQAFKAFLQRWKPTQFAESVCPPELVDANVVFRLDGDMDYLHQRPAAQAIWAAYLDRGEGEAVPCLDGQFAAVARVHPAIKGVWGGQSSGGSIVSFNQDAFESYGKSQGENAPVSASTAFAYTTALNYLLNRDHGQCVSIGDASTVLWAVADDTVQAEAAEDLFAEMMSPPDDDAENQQLLVFLQRLAEGQPLSKLRPDLDPDTQCYVLGLAPNAARISIRFWLATDLTQLTRHFAAHYHDLMLDPVPWRTLPSVWRLLIETLPKRRDVNGQLQKSDSKDISPHLAGELMRAVISGRPYPLSLLSKIIGRLRADGEVSPLRVAMIKAILVRNKGENISMALDRETKDIAYRLGRLFAVLEIAQRSALGNLNAGIKTRYYGGASTTPAGIFPMLVKNYHNHIADLQKGKKAEWVKDARSAAGWLEKEFGDIVEAFPADTPFPKTMDLSEQGRFAIGYYHERFGKKQNAPDDIAAVSDDKTIDVDSEEN